MSTSLLQLLLEIIFLTIIFLHITKKNLGAIFAYSIQSLAIVAILSNSFFETGSLSLLGVALMALLVKVILAPIFFTRLVRKNELRFSASTYLNTPFTLLVIAILTAIAFSYKFAPLTNIVPANHGLLTLSLAAMLLSLFLIVNRKGVLSQIIGILSLENSIVAFATFAGLEQMPSLQIGIIFDIFVWLTIATIFVSMIYRHFGSLDNTSMQNLKD